MMPLHNLERYGTNYQVARFHLSEERSASYSFIGNNIRQIWRGQDSWNNSLLFCKGDGYSKTISKLELNWRLGKTE